MKLVGGYAQLAYIPLGIRDTLSLPTLKSQEPCLANGRH